MAKQNATFGFLKDDTDICARPLVAANLCRHPGATSPVVQTRTGEWAFLVIFQEKLESHGPHETEGDAFRAWVDFLTFIGELPVLPLISSLDHSADQTDITNTGTGVNADFEQFMKGLL